MKITIPMYYAGILSTNTVRGHSIGSAMGNTLKAQVVDETVGDIVGDLLLTVREGYVKADDSVVRSKRKVQLHLPQVVNPGAANERDTVDTIRIEFLCDPERITGDAFLDCLNTVAETLKRTGAESLADFIRWGSFDTAS